MATPARVRSQPGRPWAHRAKTGRITNIPKRRRANTDASEALARSSAALMRAWEFTEIGDWSGEGRLRYISRLPHGNDSNPRRAHAQPAQRQPRHSPRPPGGHHGPLGIRQVLARVRHAVRRGPAPLRRIALRVRAPVPAAHGEA